MTAGVEYSVCLDHVLTNLDEVDEFAVLEDDLSDHKALSVLVKAPVPADASGGMRALEPAHGQAGDAFAATCPSAHAALQTEQVSPCGQMAQSAGPLAEAVAHVEQVLSDDRPRGEEAPVPAALDEGAEAGEVVALAATKPIRPTLDI